MYIHHIVSAMCCTYKLKPAMSKERSKHHFSTYMIYELVTMVVVVVLIIAYDVATGITRKPFYQMVTAFFIYMTSRSIMHFK